MKRSPKRQGRLYELTNLYESNYFLWIFGSYLVLLSTATVSWTSKIRFLWSQLGVLRFRAFGSDGPFFGAEKSPRESGNVGRFPAHRHTPLRYIAAGDEPATRSAAIVQQIT